MDLGNKQQQTGREGGMGKLVLPTSWREGMSMGSVPLQKPIYPDNWVYRYIEKYVVVQVTTCM